MPLHGIKHKLRYMDLHSNCIDSIHHLLQCTVGLHFLTNLILEKNGEDNPVCHLPGMNDSLNTFYNNDIKRFFILCNYCL